MKRQIYSRLIDWDKSPNRKPLILMGARQVGKTWLMEHFAQEFYPKNTVKVNLMRDELLRKNFEQADLKPQTLISLVELSTGKKVVPGQTLLIIDEIQESMRALTSLKFFYEEMPQLAIMVAGSLLGISLRRGRTAKSPQPRPSGSFPVGKVDFLDVHPMSFCEFLEAVDEVPRKEALERHEWALLTLQHEAYKELLKKYMFIGGMPEAVADYAQTRDLQKVRLIQKNILRAYDEDFEKHAISTAQLAKLRLLWNNIPAQLVKENKKFLYSALREGARAREYEEALEWLDAAGMIHIQRGVKTPRLPLKSYEDYAAFKLYMLDVGLLGAMSNLPARALLEPTAIFTNFKGALTEQYALQELCAADVPFAYWTNGTGVAELDFVLQGEQEVFPLEVKSAGNLRAQSLKVYRKLFNPKLSFRASLVPYRRSDELVDIPLYALGSVRDYLRHEEGVFPDSEGQR